MLKGPRLGVFFLPDGSGRWHCGRWIVPAGSGGGSPRGVDLDGVGVAWSPRGVGIAVALPDGFGHKFVVYFGSLKHGFVVAFCVAF
jgi:hypothetical protein